MAEQARDRADSARRNLVLCLAVVAALLATLGAVPDWLATKHHVLLDLVMQALPPVSAAALLAGICIAFPILVPQPRVGPATAITFPAMHVAITVALAHLLASRPNAFVEPLPQQIPIQAWLRATTWGVALCVELAFFLPAAVVGRPRSTPSPDPE